MIFIASQFSPGEYERKQILCVRESMTQATICPLIPPPPPHSTHNCHSMKRELSPLDLRTSVMGSILSELGLSSLLKRAFLSLQWGCFVLHIPLAGRERSASFPSLLPPDKPTLELLLWSQWGSAAGFSVILMVLK